MDDMIYERQRKLLYRHDLCGAKHVHGTDQFNMLWESLGKPGGRRRRRRREEGMSDMLKINGNFPTKKLLTR
jgi:hypothetical protein